MLGTFASIFVGANVDNEGRTGRTGRTGEYDHCFAVSEAAQHFHQLFTYSSRSFHSSFELVVLYIFKRDR